MSDLPPIDRPIVTSSRDDRRSGHGDKPNTATVIEIFLVVAALWSLLWSLFAGTTYLLSTVLCCLPIPLFMFAVAIFGLVDGVRMLLNRHRGRPRIYGILYLIALLQCDVLTVLCGVMILILCDMQTARDWYGYERGGTPKG